MSKLRPLFSFFVIFIFFVFLILLGISIYFSISGVSIRYDKNQKQYSVDVSKNAFVKSIFSRYFKNIPVMDGKADDLSERQSNPFHEINEGASNSKSRPSFDEEDLKAMVERLVVEVPDPEKEWDYKADVFTAEIKNIDSENFKLLLNFSSPKKMPLVAQEKWVTVNCSPTETFVQKDGVYSNTYYSALLEYVEVGDIFFSRCEDYACTEVGGLCRIYK